MTKAIPLGLKDREFLIEVDASVSTTPLPREEDGIPKGTKRVSDFQPLQREFDEILVLVKTVCLAIHQAIASIPKSARSAGIDGE
jgi:hypothetical protein